MKRVTMLCGVPGSGKTWVMNHLRDSYFCINHDDYISKPSMDLFSKIVYAAQGSKPVIVDCPFAERDFRTKLESLGLSVVPVFIVEKPEVVNRRYRQREGKEASKATLTRANTIMNKAHEWRAYFGTSEEVLNHLRDKHV